MNERGDMDAMSGRGAGQLPIEVWAPNAEQVEIEWTAVPESTDRSQQVHPRRDPMTPTGDGWWRWAGPASGDGDETASGDGDDAASAVVDYAFVLDGAEPALPDPRSPWQPHGVHGPSRTFDPGAFAWTDADWRGPRSGAGVLGAVVYELHLGTFTPEGTLDSARARLDHLVDLGVDVVELMPVAAFPGRWGWGYDGVDLWAVHDGYGGPAALQRFVDACHARGPRRRPSTSCTTTWAPSGNYLARFGPYFTEAHHTPWGAAVNLDHDGLAPRCAASSSRARCAGSATSTSTRCASTPCTSSATTRGRTSSPSCPTRSAALSAELGRPLDLVAESDLNDTVMVTPTAEGGRGMTAQWDDDVHHALHVALTGEAHGYYADFAGGGARDEAGPLGGARQGADPRVPPRRHALDVPGPAVGRPGRRRAARRAAPAGLPADPRPGGQPDGGRPRLGALLAPGVQAAGAVLYLLGPTTPMIFMGEEWAASTPWQFFTSFDDDALADAVRRGRRAEFGAHGWSEDAVPDPQDPATREASVLDWAEAEQGHHGRMLQWYAACTGAAPRPAR